MNPLNNDFCLPFSFWEWYKIPRMTRTRITIETTVTQKRALDVALSERGLTLPEWFSTQLEEVTAGVGNRVMPEDEELRSLQDLANPAEIVKKLRAVDWSFTDADTGYFSHDIHPYPAKFIPQLPRTLIKHLSLRGELIYDPFGGSGTTALEALLLGRRCLSTDVHPLSKIIGEAKALTLTREGQQLANSLGEQLWSVAADRDSLASEIARVGGQVDEQIPQIPNVSSWFHENAIRELAYLRWRMEGIPNPNVQILAKACFSKSILRASFQDEETRYMRRPREVPPGSVIKLFVANFQAALRKLRVLGPLLRFRRAEFKVLDLRVADVGQLGDGLRPTSVDLIVTSPPYPNSNDYHLYHRFRLFWLGFDPRDFAEKEIGSHLRHQRDGSGFGSYMEELTQCLRKLHAVLRPGRYAVFVLGEGVFSGKLYHTAEEVGRVAEVLGFEVAGIIARDVHATKRSFISTARRIRSEHLLVLHKPNRTGVIACVRPPYKLWPYEETLQRMEVTCLLPDSRPRSDAPLTLSVDSLSLDKLRRLTFVHALTGAAVGYERTWQAVLENGEALNAASRKKDPKYATHGIHPYKGKFYPQLAKAMFNLAHLEPGQAILDPFCGSGTVLLEAYLNGLVGYGIDLNVLAVKIARVKTELLEVDPYLRDQIFARFVELLLSPNDSNRDADAFPEDIRNELDSWFPKPVLRKMGWTLRQIGEIAEPRVREALYVLFSSIVRHISQQEPRDLRIRRRANPLSDGPVYELLAARVKDLRRRLQHFAERTSYAPVEFLPAKVVHGDSRKLEDFSSNGIGVGSLHAVVTSPPYATALPYIDTDRLSILLLFAMNSRERSQLECSLIGTREISKQTRDLFDRLIDAGVFEGILSETAKSLIAEIRRRNKGSDGGFRKQNTAPLLYMYFQDMSRVMKNVDVLLKPGAPAFFVVGDNRTVAGGKPILVATGQALKEIAASIGWDLVEVLPITVTQENRLHAKNSITKNAVLWFRKRS